jgi:hypothetical protein
MLGVEGVELLVEPVLGRDPGIDRTADVTPSVAEYFACISADEKAGAP